MFCFAIARRPDPGSRFAEMRIAFSRPPAPLSIGIAIGHRSSHPHAARPDPRSASRSGPADQLYAGRTYSPCSLLAPGLVARARAGPQSARTHDRKNH